MPSAGRYLNFRISGTCMCFGAGADHDHLDAESHTVQPPSQSLTHIVFG